VGECFFWYRPTRVVPDQLKAVKGLCVCVCVGYRLTQVVLEKTLLDGCSSSKVIISVIPEEKKKKNGAGI